MAHRRCRVIFGSMSVMSLVFVASVWAVPAHEYDMGWGKGALHGKHDYEKYDYEYGPAGDHEKHDKYGKVGYQKSGWDKHKGYDGHDFVKWGKGYGKDDPDCDPPVSTPEPGTLLLLGSTLAGLGVYVRRRRQPAGG